MGAAGGVNINNSSQDCQLCGVFFFFFYIDMAESLFHPKSGHLRLLSSSEGCCAEPQLVGGGAHLMCRDLFVQKLAHSLQDSALDGSLSNSHQDRFL